MSRIRIRSGRLSRLRPVSVKRAIAQSEAERPAYDLTDEHHTAPVFTIVCGALAVLVLIELAFAVVVTL